MVGLAQEMNALKNGQPVPISERPQAPNSDLQPTAHSLQPLEEKYRSAVLELRNFMAYANSKKFAPSQKPKLDSEHARLGVACDAAVQALWDSGVPSEETLKMWKSEYRGEES